MWSLRLHYLPLFSRLGAYPRPMLEELAWGRRPALFEYWGHEASLMPLSHQPLLRWRMADAAAGVGTWGGVARFLKSHRPVIDRGAAIRSRDRRLDGGLRTGPGQTHRQGRLVGVERGQAGDRMPVLDR